MESVCMDAIEDSASFFFYDAPDGTIVYAPYGRRGAGYRVTEAEERRISRRYVRVSRVVLGAFGVATVVFWRSPRFWLLAVPLVVSFRLAARYVLSRGLPRSTWRVRDLFDPLTHDRELRRREAARGIGRPALVAGVVVGGILTTFGVTAAIVERSTLPLLVSGFTAVGTARFVRLLRALGRDRLPPAGLPPRLGA
jgi:hypothetical protein